MKAKELIKKLEKCPPDYEVLVADLNRGYASPINDEGDELSTCDDEQRITLYWYADTER